MKKDKTVPRDHGKPSLAGRYTDEELAVLAYCIVNRPGHVEAWRRADPEEYNRWAVSVLVANAIRYAERRGQPI